ncbi:hypothetical protein LBWT_52740 [Leptolyngbya boryana IAM M-101]|nr:hypothetical protein LBWT_52740 [Leptolyngbya boryana IAM M-101]BAS65653.1 hypothetical protein LBDG_52740 [Leptolyngbya boryana dg5]
MIADGEGDGFGKFITFTEFSDFGGSMSESVDGIGIAKRNPCSPIAIGSMCQSWRWDSLKIMIATQEQRQYSICKLFLSDHKAVTK